MKSNHEKPWMCWKCGYTMDSSTMVHGKGDGTPAENDLSICLNCGNLYVRHDNSWKAATSQEVDSIPIETRTAIFRALTVRQLTIKKNLSTKDGHA